MDCPFYTVKVTSGLPVILTSSLKPIFFYPNEKFFNLIGRVLTTGPILTTSFSYKLGPRKVQTHSTETLN